MSATFSKDALEAFRKDEWPFRHDEFDEWPRHMRPPMMLRDGMLAHAPLLAVGAAIGSAMAAAGPALSVAGTVASLAGAAVGAGGAMAAGQNAAALGRYQQAEYVQQAETATAMGQRGMLEQRRQAGLVQSTLQARAAASGVDPTSGSVLNLSGNIAKRGEYNALMSLSEGENQAAGLYNQGEAASYQGQLTQQADKYAAVGTVASGVGSMFRSLSFSNPYGGYGGYGGGYGYGAGYGGYGPTVPLR